MYVDPNFKTKKAFRDAIAVGQTVMVFQPGPFAVGATMTGEVTIEGPHGYHKWYARVRVHEGVVKKVLQ